MSSTAGIYVKGAAVSAVAAIVAFYIGGLSSYFIDTHSQYDFRLFLSDLFSFSAMLSGLFMWIIFLPSAALFYAVGIGLFKEKISEQGIIAFGFFLSFLVIFINQINVAGIVLGRIASLSGLIGYIFHSLLAGCFCLAVIAVIAKAK